MLAFSPDNPPSRSRSSSVVDSRRLVKRYTTVQDCYEFFKRPISMRKFNDIDTVAKLIIELEYFKRMKREQDFVSVKECVTYMQFEYSPPGKVSST